jgi:two-component system chemotaxis response regulator CheY
MNKLMIVDDSNLIRRKIEREHDSKKFTVVAAAQDGVEALQLFEKHQPDVVTMDLTMPNLDGIDTIEQLVLLKPDVKILVVSALNDKATGMEALERGAMGFINKPFTEQDIQSALATIIED